MMQRRTFLWLPLVTALAGCVNLGLGEDQDAKPIVYYVMEDAGRTVSEAAPAARTLLLADTVAAAFYDTDGMVFSKQPGTRGYYQLARWSERSGKRFSDLLLARLEREKVFATVVQAGSSVRGDWLLTTEILDFYHDAASQPGVVRMVLRAEVIDLGSRSLLARKTFVQSVAVPSYDAAGAHQAFNQAVTLTLNEMSDWLKSLPGKS